MEFSSLWSLRFDIFHAFNEMLIIYVPCQVMSLYCCINIWYIFVGCVYQGDKKAERNATNEIVTCTNCGPNPCTHTANNGCAAEVPKANSPHIPTNSGISELEFFPPENSKPKRYLRLTVRLHDRWLRPFLF